MTNIVAQIAFSIAALTNSLSVSVDQRIAVSDPAVALSRFAGYLGGAAQDRFVANTNFWLKGVDFSCASPWNSQGGRLRAGTLVSKRHILFAKHCPLAVGTRIVFVGDNGGICPCRLAGTKAIDGCDIMVGALDYEVTPNVHPAKILPPNYEKYIGDGRGLPAVALSQWEKALLMELTPMSTNPAHKGIGCRQPKSEVWKPYWEKMIVGDSGNPVFLVVGNEVILLYCLYGGYSGPAIHRFRYEIQQAMDELCPGYRLEEFDFEGLGKE